MRKFLVRSLFVMTAFTPSHAALAQNNTNFLFPEITVKDTTSLWNEHERSWRFSARISLLFPQAIRGGRPADASSIGGLPQPDGDGTALPAPQLISATVHYARHVFPRRGAHEVASEIRRIAPWPVTGFPPLFFDDKTEPAPLPPFDRERLDNDEEARPPVVGITRPILAPPTDKETKRETPKRGNYLNANVLAFPIVPGSDAARGDSLFWQWTIVWRDRTGEERTTVSSRQRLVVDCTAEDTRRDLMRLQRQAVSYEQELGDSGSVGADGRENDQRRNALERDGFGPKPHLEATIRGNGLTIANQEALDGNSIRRGILDNPNVDLAPSLVFYQPRRASAEIALNYQNRISDPIIPNRPAKLIGFAYAQPHDSVTRRPRLGCIPSESWFIHEAGFHHANGNYTPTPPRERVRGEALELEPRSFNWHGRIWDTHFWFDPACPDRSCPPIISIFAPFPVQGLALPEPLFFYSEVFE